MSRLDGLVRTRDGDLVLDPDLAAAQAAEQRAALERERAAAAAAHRCDDGWLGEDATGRPVPCPWCKTHLLARAARPDGLALGSPTVRHDRARAPDARWPTAPDPPSRNRQVPETRPRQTTPHPTHQARRPPMTEITATTAASTAVAEETRMIVLPVDVDLTEIADLVEQRADQLAADVQREADFVVAVREGRAVRTDVRTRAIEVVLGRARVDRLRRTAETLRAASQPAAQPARTTADVVEAEAGA